MSDWISSLNMPNGTILNLKDSSAIVSIARTGDTFTATKHDGSTFTFTQHDIAISSNPSNPNIITITDNDGNTYDVDIIISDATQSASGLMSATDKTKLDGVASGAEVNQFAFSTVEVTQGQTVTTLSADSKTDTLSIVAGDNITLTPTAVSDRVVFSAKDTTYTLIQDSTDKHKFTLHDSDGNDTTITIPDNDTTYTLSADPATGKIVLTPSSGSPISITVPNATHADSATADEDGDDIRTTYATSLDQNPSDGHVLQLKDKNGNVLSTATVPDNNTTYTFENGTNGFSVTPSGGSKQTVTVTPSIANATQSKSGLMSANDKKKLDGVEAGADVNVIETVKVNGTALTPDANKAVNVTVPTKTSDLTNDSDYVSDASYVHTDNNYTSTEKSKLAGIASGAEVNQNAFSNVKVGTTTIAADGKTDTLELSAGSNISLTPDATNDKVTVAVTGLGTAATKNYTTSVTSGSGDLVTSGAVASAISSAIDDLPEPMIFQGTLGTGGTITALPTASNSNIGYTYKVITAGMYGGVASKVGDTFVSTELPKGSGTYTWVHIPSGDDIEDTWRNIKINGTEKLGTGISSGAVDFVNGNATTVSFNATGNKVSISHADTSSQASVNNSGRTYVQDITLDEYGHVTGIASATETVTNTDRYVNSASFADDTTASANSPVKMTLTRAGSDTVSVTANIPKVSSSSAGVAPKGSAVSSQSQSTKFLREDGTWAAPTYTVNTDTKVTAVGNHYTPTENTGSQLDADASSTTAATWNSTSLVTGVTIKRDAKGHVTGLAVDSIKMPANPNTNTTYTFAEGSTNGAFSVTPSGGSAQSVPVHGLKSAAYTESSAYATSGHTHATSIATSTGTNQITLSHGGKYAITAGGTSYIFTMPSDNNTDTLVTQTATSTNATYEVLFSATADNTTRTETARKNNNLTFNPSTGTLSTTNVSASSAIATNDLDTNYLTTGSASITEANVGDLIVTGAARFLNTINGSISGNAATASDSAKLNGYASAEANTGNTIVKRTSNGYINATYFNQSSGAETPTSSSYIIYANSDGYFRKSTVANMKTAMSLNNVENKSSATIRGELTSANVTTALGYTPVNKAGDTMTGELINQQGGIWVQGGSAAGGNVDRMTLTAGMPTELKYNGGKRGLRLYSNAVAIADPYNGNSNSDAGWIRHIEETSNSSTFEIATGDDGNESIVMRQYNTSSAVAREAKILGADGATSFPVSVTAPKFIGNLQGTADNSDKVDGYHIYYDRYVSSTQLAQPTADTIWYVKVSTANWNSNIEVIQIRTGGNNRTGSHVLYTGSRGTKWWGYGQVYSHRGLSGVYKVISNSDDIYLRFDADCTSATIYTSFTPQTLAIVDSPSGANYTEVPTYGGWYGNQITVDHIQTNNYITIQKQTVASSTFADTNPKIVFKNADGSQNGSLTWTDYDSVQSPASLTLNGNQGGEYFIAPNIKATGSFYGTLSGHASLDLALTGGTMTGQIISNYNQAVSWLNCGKYPDIHINNNGASGWIGGNTKTGRHVICTYANSDDLLYFNWYSNTTLAGTENKFDKSFTWNPATNILSTNISGNASTATKATQDESGNNIKASYASSFSISDHTITLKNKNGASLGTVTVPDNNTTYSAGTGLALSGTTFRTTVPRVAKDSHSLPGQNTCIVEEYTNGTNYNLPSNHYYHIYSSQGSDVNYGCQLALGMTTAGVYYREYNNKTWGSWRSLINTDTNTHRPIQMNGTEILGNNTTALNLKAGTNVSLSNSSGTVTITATDTTYSAGTGLTLSGTQFSVSAANASTIMNLLTTGSSAPTDNDYYIAQYAGGGTSTTTYHRRPHSALWSYIKGKADSTYLASTTKYAGSSSVGGAANSANQLNDNTSYINSGTSYVTHTDVSVAKTYLSRYNNMGINSSNSAGCFVLASNWSSTAYNCELSLGMGDSLGIYYRGKNNGTYTSWQAVGRFSATPTSGQVVITDGTTGGMKSSGYTIAKSVPSNAVFTDTNYYHTTGLWSGLTYTATANGGAGALAFTIPTGTSATTVAVGNHTHGLLNNDFTVGLANTTEDSGWSMINSSYNGYLLKSIRFNSSSPAWGVGSYGSGICFGGGDTKGILSVAYGSPNIKIAGGNGTKPVWWLGLTGTSGTSYNLNDITNGNARDNTKLPITNNAGYHNSIYRGKSLGTSITTAQWSAISSGTFDDLYIGDYWTLSTTINGTTSNINYVIAAFDYWWNCGDSYPQGANKHHVVLVPSGYLYTAQMNTSNVTTGGYISSAMYTTNLTAAREGISTLFGDHLYSVRRLFTTAVNAVGQATGWGWYTSSVDLMNENMVYGSSVWTTSGYEVGVDRNILPLFLLNPASASIRADWWLRSVATPAYFASVNSGGGADFGSASLSYGVRPAFAIY